MMIKLVLLSLLLFISNEDHNLIVSACTTIGVGKLASSDGSVFCSHSNDGEGNTDPRLVLIPPADWPTNSSRPVFYSPEDYPRYVGTERGPIDTYHPDNNNGEASFERICEIPQVPHTYQYYEETYGALNEKQLGIAESTCSGVFGAAPKGIYYDGYGIGKACFSIDVLTQIAMERHSKARHAIQEMGALAEQYGFYGAGLFEGTSESLIVTDVDEVWVFHILPDPTGESAIWAAQRVPDDHFTVVSNAFIIRGIDRDDADYFMYSESVYDVAIELGWYDENSDELLDFTATYSDGEYSHKYYSGRRSWGVYHLFAPSLQLSAEYEEWRISNPYPVSAKPDHPLHLKQLAYAMGYFYQGTDYAQTEISSDNNNVNSNDNDGSSTGSSKRTYFPGGPWDSPDHVAGMNNTVMPVNEYGVAGHWERTIGLYRTSDVFIVQSRGWLPDSVGGIIWYGAYSATYTIYTPFPAGLEALPADVTLGHHMTLNKRSLFWASRYLGNYVQLKWNVMMKEVMAFQEKRMDENLNLQSHIDQNPSDIQLYSQHAKATVDKIWDLCDHLMFKYADGQVHSTVSALGTSTPPRQYDTYGATTQGAQVVDQPGYPVDWLEAVGFSKGPPPPPDCSQLEWKCGHKPPNDDEEWLMVRIKTSGTLVDKKLLRHEHHKTEQEVIVKGDDDDNQEEGGFQIALWKEYLSKKAIAKENNAICGHRGDIAAAIGKCNPNKENVVRKK